MWRNGNKNISVFHSLHNEVVKSIKNQDSRLQFEYDAYRRLLKKVLNFVKHHFVLLTSSAKFADKINK